MATRTPSYKPTMNEFRVLVVILVAYGLAAGSYAGLQPTGTWRFFSWHPLLMTLGMITIPGGAAGLKKLGGYTNTKNHALLGWASIFLSAGGLYVIYQNKENMGRRHLLTVHALAGAAVFCGMVGAALVGAIFLHPDTGLDKTNQTLRFAHKTFSRAVLVAAWMTATYGLYQLVPPNPEGTLKWVMFAAPLVCLVPYVLL